MVQLEGFGPVNPVGAEIDMPAALQFAAANVLVCALAKRALPITFHRSLSSAEVAAYQKMKAISSNG